MVSHWVAVGSLASIKQLSTFHHSANPQSPTPQLTHPTHPPRKNTTPPSIHSPSRLHHHPHQGYQVPAPARYQEASRHPVAQAEVRESRAVRASAHCLHVCGSCGVVGTVDGCGDASAQEARAVGMTEYHSQELRATRALPWEKREASSTRPNPVSIHPPKPTAVLPIPSIHHPIHPPQP